MTDTQVEMLLQAIKGSFAMCGTPIDDWILDLWMENLVQRPFQPVIAALKEASMNGRMPPLKDVIARIDGRVDDKDEAQDCADRIIEAIPRFGSYRSTEALAHLGELAAEVVKRFGGWSEGICNVQSKDLPTMRAQLRDSARSILAKAKAGTLGVATALPKPSMPTQGLNSAAGLIEGILPPRSKP